MPTTWSKDKIDTIPVVYRDIMLALKPVVDSRDSAFQVPSIPTGQIFNGLSLRYDYSPSQVQEMIGRLGSVGLVRSDAHGFHQPTDKGESLIQALADAVGNDLSPVPPLPEDLF